MSFYRHGSSRFISVKSLFYSRSSIYNLFISTFCGSD